MLVQVFFLTHSDILKGLLCHIALCVCCLFLQWFGNIVTMDWWDDLWLNEGFASFFEYVGVEVAETEWGMVRTCLLSHKNQIKSIKRSKESFIMHS